MNAPLTRSCLRVLFSLGVLFTLGACQSARQNIAAPVGGRTFSGQVQYSGSTRSFVGEFTAISSPAAFQLVISKGLPLLSVQQAGEVARLEFAGRSWQGSTRRAPAPARTWLALADVFAQLNSNPGSHFESVQPGLWTAEIKSVGPRPSLLRLDFPATNERLTFVFSKTSATLTGDRPRQ